MFDPDTLNVYLIPFVIAIPIAILLLLAARRDDAAAADPAPPAAPAAPRHDGPAAILVVDDSAVARAKLRKLFETAGYAVVLANDGVQALEQLGHGRFAVMVTDLEMPNMNGIELIAAVQGKLDTEDLPIVAITGHDELQARVHDCQGLYGIFKKPWNDRELLKRIEALVSLRPARTTA
ncbi:response regulator [Aquabacterium sp.]|uniref:response regulator n=1 Tax=Aquabacterium sp. TaxID=1872578 RepID=UPI002C5B9003|nr:response regulator [Aquabacterium sp.]HSW05226.1 response regulator [Aquabacterium sp.]